jgi:hypothetical protein
MISRTNHFFRLLSLYIFQLAAGFSIHSVPTHVNVRIPTRLLSSDASSTTTTTTTSAEKTTIDPKEAVKIFGRLAEKYIMLDDSGGMCCYSACTDCEYRLPGGGYRMADQSSSRPKWIPSYSTRKFDSLNKEHTTMWSEQIFTNGPAVGKDEFVERLIGMKFTPPLGGPYLSASSGGITETELVEKVWDLFAGNKEKLTKFRMETRIKELAGGNEGLVWSDFMDALSS